MVLASAMRARSPLEPPQVLPHKSALQTLVSRPTDALPSYHFHLAFSETSAVIGAYFLHRETASNWLLL